jgi:cytochrome oxidase Cu insertion factor (SCO1/SenC/PrrC family)
MAGDTRAGRGTRPNLHVLTSDSITHSSLVLLVNEDGYVERAYNGQAPAPGTAIDDAWTLIEEW